jgi:hypothetical protein
MATVFESLSLSGIRLSHLRQLLSYIENRDREGWYYGPRDQFEMRHKDLLDWISNAVEYGESEGVRFPKGN